MGSVIQGKWKPREKREADKCRNLCGAPQPSHTQPQPPSGTSHQAEPCPDTSAHPGWELPLEAPNTWPGPHLSEEHGVRAEPAVWRGLGHISSPGEVGQGRHQPGRWRQRALHSLTPALQQCHLPRDGHCRAASSCASPRFHCLAENTGSACQTPCYADWPML